MSSTASASAAASAADLRAPFVVDGKTFSHVGRADADIDRVDAWLRAHNLPKLSTHLSVAQTVDRPLLLCYKNTNRNVLAITMDESDRVQLGWLQDCRIATQPDGERAVTYKRTPIAATDRLAGARVEERARAEARVTFGIAALPDDELVAVKMPTRTPVGIDAGIEEWRCGFSVSGTPYWAYYLYLEIARGNIVAYMLVEDQDGDIFVAEWPVEQSLQSAFFSRSAAAAAPNDNA